MNTEANNEDLEDISAEEFNKRYLSDKFDARDIFEREVQPHLEKVYDLCKQHNLPIYCAVIVANDDNKFVSNQTVHFNGPERVPAHLPLMQLALQNLDSNEANRFIDAINMVQAMNGVMAGVEAQDETKH